MHFGGSLGSFQNAGIHKRTETGGVFENPPKRRTRERVLFVRALTIRKKMFASAEGASGEKFEDFFDSRAKNPSFGACKSQFVCLNFHWHRISMSQFVCLNFRHAWIGKSHFVCLKFQHSWIGISNSYVHPSPPLSCSRAANKPRQIKTSVF